MLPISRRIFLNSFLKLPLVNYSSDPLSHKEAPIVENSKILDDEVEKEKDKLSNLIQLPKEVKFVGNLRGGQLANINLHETKFLAP